VHYLAAKEIFMHTNLAIMGIGGGEIVFVMVVALVLFGANKIPQFAKGLGQGIKEFKKASSDDSNEVKNDKDKEK
jgi:sec-independent protein translocase protein TatA